MEFRVRVVAVWVVCIAIVSPAWAQVPPIPGFDDWESQMLSYGATQCESYADPGTTFDSKLGSSYYDAIRVFTQIAQYTGDSGWYDCVEDIKEVYRDNYVIANNGVVPGYWSFSQGMTLDYARTSEVASKNGVVYLSENAPFCTDSTAYAAVSPITYSRETAYCINAMINAEGLGEPHQTRLSQAGDANDWVDAALGHLDQWFGAKTATCIDECASNVPVCSGKYYFQPFMVAITVEALIREFNRSGDSRIQAAITTALDELWVDAWIPADNAMWYQNCKNTPGDAWIVDAPNELGLKAADLNQLIAYGYAWLYTKTSDSGYRDKAYALFNGAILGQAELNYLYYHKQFNQNYTFSFASVALLEGEVTVPHLRALGIAEGDTFARFVIGAPELKYEIDCSVVVKEGVSAIETISSTEGLATRHLQTSVALDASTAYTATQSCTDLASDTNEYAFTTKATPAGGDRTVPIQIAAAPTYSGIARATVQYDDNASLSSPTTVQNTDCAGACTINLTLAAGRYWYRVIRQTAGDVTVAVGGVQPLSVP